VFGRLDVRQLTVDNESTMRRLFSTHARVRDSARSPRNDVTCRAPSSAALR
jgi:hypothetical protein